MPRKDRGITRKAVEEHCHRVGVGDSIKRERKGWTLWGVGCLLGNFHRTMEGFQKMRYLVYLQHVALSKKLRS